MADFQKFLEDIRQDTGWSDYDIARWINEPFDEPIVHQPQLFNMRMGKLGEDYEPRYQLGHRIKMLHRIRNRHYKKKTNGK